MTQKNEFANIYLNLLINLKIIDEHHIYIFKQRNLIYFKSHLLHYLSTLQIKKNAFFNQTIPTFSWNNNTDALAQYNSINRFSIEERRATPMTTALRSFVSLPGAITGQTMIRKNGSRRARGHIGTVNFLDFPFHLYPLLPFPPLTNRFVLFTSSRI